MRADSLPRGDRRRVPARHGSEESYDVLVLALVGGGVQAMLHGLKRGLGGARRSGPSSSPAMSASSTRSSPTACCCGTARTSSSPTPARTPSVSAPCTTAWAPTSSSVTEVALPFLGGDALHRRARPLHGRLRRPALRAGEPQGPYVPAGPAGASTPGCTPSARCCSSCAPSRASTPRTSRSCRTRSWPSALDLPPNFRLVYGHMGEVLDRTDLLVTISSTAALESLHRRIPTVVLTDLGVREALGNHHFVGSGCLASWDQLDAGHRPAPDEDWVARQGVAADGSYATAFDAARERIAELLGRPGGLPAPHPLLHARHRARLSARHPRPPPPRPRRQPAARGARRRQGARTGAADRAPGGARRLPARRAARGARHPADGGAVSRRPPPSHARARSQTPCPTRKRDRATSGPSRARRDPRARRLQGRAREEPRPRRRRSAGGPRGARVPGAPGW